MGNFHLIFGLILTLNSGCFLRSSPAQAGNSSDQIRVAEKAQDPWETWLLEFVSDKIGRLGRAFALLSFGGFAGAGNGQMIFVMQESPDKEETFYFDLPSHSTPGQNQKPELLEKNLDQESVKNFKSLAREFPEAGFKNKHPAMDGFSYEFFEFQSDEKLKKIKHFKMDYPGYSHDGSKPHQKILEAFRSLKNKAKSLKEKEK